jgi:hypothetical protein
MLIVNIDCIINIDWNSFLNKTNLQREHIVLIEDIMLDKQINIKGNTKLKPNMIL